MSSISLYVYFAFIRNAKSKKLATKIDPGSVERSTI